MSTTILVEKGGLLYVCQAQKSKRSGLTWRCAACNRGSLGRDPKVGSHCRVCSASVAVARSIQPAPLPVPVCAAGEMP